MSDLNEMAIAFEQARTAPDPSDKASAQQMLSEMHGVAAVRARLQGNGRPDCLDCGEDILPARRQAVKNAVRCVPCEEIHAQMEARRRG
ncbi:MAG TPA: TraR/DksA family transcriptional regulator [Pseudomonas sp.]|nr:TraR/DksA family transcriptional regulator [Pseudomonas sp.]|tara:strand:- start:1040 stop:1306 length:267 start_codon:yes stop_codon:yes gene_type:complete